MYASLHIWLNLWWIKRSQMAYKIPKYHYYCILIITWFNWYVYKSKLGGIVFEIENIIVYSYLHFLCLWIPPLGIFLVTPQLFRLLQFCHWHLQTLGLLFYISWWVVMWFLQRVLWYNICLAFKMYSCWWYPIGCF